MRLHEHEQRAWSPRDGTFQFANIPPGRYNLNVRPHGHAERARASSPSMPITVGNEDIDNVIVTTSLGAIARGVVVTDDGSVPTFRSDQVQIFPAADGNEHRR